MKNIKNNKHTARKLFNKTVFVLIKNPQKGAFSKHDIKTLSNLLSNQQDRYSSI